MTVKKIMSKKVVTVEMDDTLLTVKHIFENVSFHHLLVLEAGKLFGVLSDRDMFKALSPRLGSLFETSDDKACLNKKVHQIMTRNPIILNSEASIYDAVKLFNRHRISCIPIVDENKKPVGIISWRDILNLLGEKLESQLKKNKFEKNKAMKL